MVRQEIVTRGDDQTFIGGSQEGTFKVTVTPAMLKATPSWKPSAADPPLSARRAIKLADRCIGSIMKKRKKFRWDLESISLLSGSAASDDKWFWIARYVENPTAGGTGATGTEPDFYVAVLMDGTVAKVTRVDDSTTNEDGK
jgi:hypothetical protein